MESKTQPGIYFAPLQGSTNFVYRRSHSLHFGGIDKYFSPYLMIRKDGDLKKSQLRDTSPENCSGYSLVPQILAGNSSDFLFLVKHLENTGYEEINWNLGCPYPMVTRKGMGSGLLPQPEKIREILDNSIPKLNCRISVKMRAGLSSTDEIFQVIPVLNDYPLIEVIFHPRIARQLYSGTPDRDLFEQISDLSSHPLVYNGDLCAVEDFHNAQVKLQSVTNWMIGRGLLKNPFLAMEIKGIQLPGRKGKIDLLEHFHDGILTGYATMLSGQSHLITSMIKFWEYFCFLFPVPHKAFKLIKKSVNLSKYEMAVRENFLQLRNEE